MASLSLPLIQVGQLSVTDKRMCTNYVNHLGLSCPGKVYRLTDSIDVTIVVDWDVKPQNKQKFICSIMHLASYSFNNDFCG